MRLRPAYVITAAPAAVVYGYSRSAILAVTAAFVVYLLVITVSPTGRCGRCRGKGVVQHGRRFTECPRCHARRYRYRPGAHPLHRMLHEHAGPAIRERLRPLPGDDERTGS